MNSHIGLIAQYSMRFAMRTGGGIIFILVLLTVGFSIASLFISPVEVLIEKSGTTAAEAYKLLSSSKEVNACPCSRRMRRFRAGSPSLTVRWPPFFGQS